MRASDRLDRAGAPAAALAVDATALPRPVSSGKQLAHFAKRWLYLIHRWVGIGASLLLAMWFLSGFVMLYVPYPSLTQAERLAGLAPIQWQAVHAFPAIGEAAKGARIMLEQGVDGPRWRVRAGTAEHSYSATTGALQPPADEARARRVAEAFSHARVRSVERVERDQWTVAGGFNFARPLWKLRLATPDNRELYVSSTSSAVVQDTLDWERLWNWLGSVPHWIYPTLLRQDQPLWRQVVIWTSFAGIVSAATGMWIGVLRFRLRKRFKGGRMSPYQGWKRWHHWFGLTGGLLLTTWIVSGWLSVDPGRVFESPGLSEQALATYSGAGALPVVDWARAAQAPALRDARQVRLAWAGGTPLLVPEHQGDMRPAVDARTLTPVAYDAAQLRSAATKLLPGVSVAGAEWIHASDNYWYDTSGPIELPVLRVRFDDAAGTWVHLSPRTGEMVGDIDTRRRVYRWLYSGLHDWDIAGFVTRRPLWDLWMWLWLLPGTIVSVSSVVIGWQRLRRSAKSK